jgi:3-methyladenine DNA glycosylase/8-oxoguanine DNA glycosylase
MQPLLGGIDRETERRMRFRSAPVKEYSTFARRLTWSKPATETTR